LRRIFSFASLSRSRRGGALAGAAAVFALGLVAGPLLRPQQRNGAPIDVAGEAAPASRPGAADIPIAHRLDPATVYPAEVLRVIDGDTFEARVRVWPGLDVDTKVRLRGVDAAELHARCADELAKAQAARTALEMMLADGGVAVSRVGIDKYGGRVDAAVSTRSIADVSAALLDGGFARSYDGGKRESWCG
jgi:endonuclease YncB( thermonuclease family)